MKNARSSDSAEDAALVGPAVREHQERRQLAVGGAVGGVRRGEVEGPRHGPVARGEGDRLGLRQHRRVQRDGQRAGEDPGRLGRRRVHAQDDASVVGAGHDRHAVVAGHAQPLELRERRLERRDGPIRLDAQETVGAVAARDGQDGAVGTERVRRPPEDPGGIAQLGVHRREVAGRAGDPVRAVERVQVPPARLVRDGVQDTRRAPRRLDHADARAAGHGAGARRASRRRGPPPTRSRTAVPGHVRQVPLQPGERPSVRRRARARDEVRPAHEDPARAVGAVEGQRHDLVDHESRVVGPVGIVRLADRVQAREPGVEPEVRVAPRALRRDRLGLREPVGVQPVQAAVGLRRRHHPSAVDGVRAAAVLVDAVAHLERERRQLRRPPVEPVAEQRPPAALGRAALQPVDVVPVEPRLGRGRPRCRRPAPPRWASASCRTARPAARPCPRSPARPRRSRPRSRAARRRRTPAARASSRRG